MLLYDFIVTGFRNFEGNLNLNSSSDIVGVANKETCVLCVYSVYVLCERASVFLIKTIKGPFSVTWLQTGRKCKHKM